MSRFDYIADDAHREAIERIFSEFNAVFRAKSWLASILLAGNLLEALFVEYLVFIDFQSKYKIDPFKLSIDKILGACHKEGLSVTTKPAVKNFIILYRKLIHPNTQVRLSVAVSEKEAVQSSQLIEQVREEILKRQRALIGVTADDAIDQILSNKLSDEEVKALLESLKPQEMERFLKNVVPRRLYSQHLSTAGVWQVNGSVEIIELQKMYRLAMELASDELKAAALDEHVSLLNTDKEKGTAFIDVLFRPEDLDAMSPPNAKLAKQHIFERMEKSPNHVFLDTITDIWFHLTKEDIDEFVNVCVSCIIYGTTQDTRIEAKAWLSRNSWKKMSGELKSSILTPLQRWIENYEFFNDNSHAEMVRELKAIAKQGS